MHVYIKLCIPDVAHFSDMRIFEFSNKKTNSDRLNLRGREQPPAPVRRGTERCVKHNVTWGHAKPVSTMATPCV